MDGVARRRNPRADSRGADRVTARYEDSVIFGQLRFLHDSAEPCEIDAPGQATQEIQRRARAKTVLAAHLHTPVERPWPSAHSVGEFEREVVYANAIYVVYVRDDELRENGSSIRFEHTRNHIAALTHGI